MGARTPLVNRFFFLLTSLSVVFAVNCTDDDELSGANLTNYWDTVSDSPVVDNLDTSDSEDVDIVDDAESYDLFKDPCVECKYYFCPPLDSVWQKQICQNNCEDPPVVVYESECIEYLECDPSQPVMQVDMPCQTEDGQPGLQDKLCQKGKIYYTDCETECVEEVCDGEDNDCDGLIDEGFAEIEEICNNIDDNCNGLVDEGEWECDNGCGSGPSICVAGEMVCLAPTPQEEVCDYMDNDCDGLTDEGQTNACGACGTLPIEICDGIDNNCDGDVDEDLINPCSTACGNGYEMCIDGTWLPCNAPPVLEEICDGFDNDCDGQIDEDLECVCTVQDVGTLFQCTEPPLICGQGFKTCECLDPGCKDIVMTPCMASCYWMTDPPGADPNCDPFLGMELNQEKCNNFDENCNGLIDEYLNTGCYTGPPDTMGVGVCVAGYMYCESGVWGNESDTTGMFIPEYCKDEVVPSPEVCNGVDDDCDGIADWGEELKETDILFVIDWSGSMNDEIDAVMIALNKFAQEYSDETVLQWGVVLGPRKALTIYQDSLELYQDITSFSTFLNSMTLLNGQSMSGGSEMLLDALYLSVQNISTGLPYTVQDLDWDGVAESSPEKELFKLSWRPEADKIIIVFTDEEEQSYMDPELTSSDVISALVGAPKLSLYAFTDSTYDEWDEIADATGGVWYKLVDDPTSMYNSLMEILEQICKDLPEE